MRSPCRSRRLTVREMVVDAKGDIVREPDRRGANPPPRRTVATRGAQAGPVAQGARRRLRRPRQPAVFEQVKTGIAGDKYFEVLSGIKDGDEVIIGPFSSVRDLRDGAAVKVEARRDRHGGSGHVNAAMGSVPRIGGDRAAIDLVEQAALVPDGAREHRRGDVDHRRGVADPGHERQRHRRDRHRRWRRQLHDPADAADPHAGRRGTGAQQSAHHAAGRRGDPPLRRPHRRRARRAGAVRRPDELRQRRRSRASRCRGCRATTSTSRRSTSTRAA